MSNSNSSSDSRPTGSKLDLRHLTVEHFYPRSTDAVQADHTFRALRICHITTFFPPYSFGGDGIYIERLSRQLAGAGHSVDVIHCPAAFAWSKSKKRVQGVDGLSRAWQELGALVKTYFFGRHRKTLKVIQSWVDKNQYDVVHLHNVSLVGGMSLFQLEHPLIFYTPHDHWFTCPKHFKQKWNGSVCKTPRNCVSCCVRSRRLPPLGRLLSRRFPSLDQVRAVLCGSPFMAREMKPYSSNIEVLPLFAHPDTHPTPRHAPIAGERPYFLFVGRLEPEKGVQTLIQLFHDTSGWRGEPELVVVGEGSLLEKFKRDQYRNVRFLGWLQGPELQTHYRGAMATIVPSEVPETFNLVVAESLGCGTPAIVHRIGALADYENIPGVLSYSSAPELVQHIQRTLENRITPKPPLEWTPDAHLRRYLALCEKYRSQVEADAPRAPFPTPTLTEAFERPPFQ